MAKSKVPHRRQVSRRLALVGRPTTKLPKPRRWTDDEVRTVVEFAILGRELELMTAFSAQVLRPEGRWWRLGSMDVGLASGGSATGDLKQQLLAAMPRAVALVNQLGRDPQAGADLRALVAPITTGLVQVACRQHGVEFPLDPWRNTFLRNLPIPIVEQLDHLARRRHWRKFSALAIQHGYSYQPEKGLRPEFERKHRAEAEAGSVDVWLRHQLDEKVEDRAAAALTAARPAKRVARGQGEGVRARAEDA